MEAFNINPFIRMASHITYIPANKTGSPGDCRIIYITEGNAEVFIQNKHYSLIPDSLFYVPDKTPYKICGSKPLKLYVMNFDLICDNTQNTAIIPIQFDEHEILQASDTEAEFPKSHIFIQDATDFKPDVISITDETNNENDLSKEMAGGLLKLLLLKLLRYRATGKHISNPLSAVLEFIHSNYTSVITNKQLAKIAGYHEYHLNRIFTAKLGKSIHGYVLDLRLKKAEHLLISNDRPVAEIAEICGFSSNTYFSSYFHKKIGYTPTEYRSIYRFLL